MAEKQGARMEEEICAVTQMANDRLKAETFRSSPGGFSYCFAVPSGLTEPSGGLNFELLEKRIRSAKELQKR